MCSRSSARSPLGLKPARTERGWKGDRAAAAALLSTLFLSLAFLNGCRTAPRRSASIAPAQVVDPGYVDVRQYASAHPASGQLQALDRDIARLQGARAPDRQKPDPIEAPTVTGLPFPPPDEAQSPASRGIDAERARASIREDYALREKAQPDPGEAEYQRELERLRRRFLELRDLPQPEDDREALRQALAQGEEIMRLERRLRELEPRANDRLFQPRGRLRERREGYRRTREALEALYQQRRERLQASLELPRRERPRIPPELLERAERERDALRRRALEQLRQLERAELGRISQIELPPPLPALSPPEPDGDSGIPGSTRIAVVKPAGRTGQPASDSNLRSVALRDLRRQRDQLRAAMMDDLRATARAAGKGAGIAVTFERGSAPDRTAELLPRVRAYLSQRVEGEPR